MEAASLDADALAAVKLALKTKRLPLTDDDLASRNDTSRPLYERYSSGISGIPLDDYFKRYVECSGLTAETLALTEFLIRHRRAFREAARIGFNSKAHVARFVDRRQSEAWLRALYVFTQADQAEWAPADVQPAHRAAGFNIRELYVKAMATYHPPVNVAQQLVREGFTPDHLDILEEFRGVFSGAYGRLSNRFFAHLVDLAEDPNKGPLVRLISDGPSTIIGVAAKDYRGLAASITGGLAAQGIPLLQAHLFSGKRYGLVLDFFHIVVPDRAEGSEVATQLNTLIRDQHVPGELSENTPSDSSVPFEGKVSFRRWDNSGRYQLQVETEDQAVGLMHALTSRIYRFLEANIFGLTAYTAGETAYASVYLELPEHLSFPEAAAIVKREFSTDSVNP